MGYCADILSDALALIGFDDPRLSAVAEKIDADKQLVALLRAFDGVGPADYPEKARLQKLQGEDYLGFFVLPILRQLPQAKAIYNGLRLPDELYRFTMADIMLNLRVYDRIHGRLGLNEGQFGWLQLHTTGELFRLGRLQFRRYWLDKDTDFSGLSLPSGTPLIDTHIPADGPLNPEAFHDSYRQALPFFRDIFGFQGEGFVCHSWLLADELKGFLPEGANILAFANEYRPSGPGVPDDMVFGFAFNVEKPDDLSTLPENSQLQRNMKRHLLAGGHIHGRRGFRPLD